VGNALKQMERSVMWWIGDWVNFGERRYGEKYAQALEATPYEYATLRDAAWVAGRIELSRRRDNLSWSHHRVAAALATQEEADEILARAVAEKLSRNDLRAEVARLKSTAYLRPNENTCTVSDLNLLIEAGTTFRTIYADPPWLYGNQGTRAATSNHYDGMTVEDICALPIEQLAHEDAHLHLWTTNAFLEDAFKVMRAWGFEYKSCFVWVKPQMGIGNYWRVSHEFLLFGIRGKAPFMDHGLRSWGEFKRSKHSAKPEEIRSYIERASLGPYLELFGRKVSEGWTVWGNQIERTMFDQSVPEVTA
jgi:N6-adenosine-specific RNA methylase IME4